MKQRELLTPRSLQKRHLRRIRELLVEVVGDKKTKGLLAEIAEEYGWTHSLGLGLSSGGGEPVSGGGPSDPTQTAALDDRRGGARETCRQVARDLYFAEKKTLRAVAELRQIAGRLGHARMPAPPESGSYPKTASDADVEAAREAQRRREARGEGWGHG